MRAKASLAIVVMLACSFIGLASTAGSGNVAIAVASLSFVFVFGLWFLYRDFSLHGSLSRAIAVGEPAEVFALIGVTPPRRFGLRSGMPMVLYQAMALEQQGKFEDALRLLRAHPLPATARRWQRLAGLIEAGVLAHTDAAAGRTLWTQTVAAGPFTPRSAEAIMAALTDGRLRLMSHDAAGAIEVLLPLTRNIQLGPAQRGLAHYNVAQAFDVLLDPSNAELHRDQARKFGGKQWFTAKDPAPNQ